MRTENSFSLLILFDFVFVFYIFDFDLIFNFGKRSVFFVEEEKQVLSENSALLE